MSAKSTASSKEDKKPAGDATAANGDGKKADGAANMLGGGRNINQIREILFGQFQRETEGRFGRLHEVIDRAGEDNQERIALAEERFNKALEVAVNGIERRLSDLMERLAEAEREAKREVDLTAKNMSNQLATAEESLRNELRAYQRSSTSDIAELKRELDTSIRKLAESKTSRQDLGDYLMEVGIRLKKDPTLDAIQTQLSDAIDGEGDALSALESALMAAQEEADADT